MPRNKRDFDAIVVGSGPNGFAAAIALQQAGLSVLLLESKDTSGGGLRSAHFTLPGFTHDVCSAVHPLAAGSPFLATLPLHDFGLEYIFPPVAASHPFDDGSAAMLVSSIEKTAESLGSDSVFYERAITSLLKDWPLVKNFILGPLRVPKRPLAAARFGLNALSSASGFAKKHFSSSHARGLWAGMAAHSMQPLSNIATSAIALVLLLLAHNKGWPIIKGGSQRLADALAAYFVSLGGKIETGVEVKSIRQLPSTDAVLFDVSPGSLLNICGDKFSSFYRWQLNRYRYGMGVFKIDWALDAPTPFTAEGCSAAGTVHLGGSFEEIVESERLVYDGKHPEKPFVLFSQPSLFDSSRAPDRKHTAWAYCHVPNGSIQDMTIPIEKQVERFAPGFRDRVLARHVMNSRDFELYNPNYTGGDINGGVQDIRQLFTRPALRFSPYRTSAKGIYICSSSTPPGGGVHGMCGYHAAQRVLKDIFKRT